MQLATSAQLLVLAALFNLAAALGINCRGDGGCGVAGVLLTRAIEPIDPGRWFANGEQIACVSTAATTSDYSGLSSAYCAFLQNTGGAWGSRILELAHYLRDHGCKGCGSVPYFYPDDNDVSHGELTYSSVNRPCSYSDGLCYVTTARSAASAMGVVNIPILPIVSFLWIVVLLYRWI